MRPSYLTSQDAISSIEDHPKLEPYRVIIINLISENTRQVTGCKCHTIVQYASNSKMIDKFPSPPIYRLLL